MSSILDKITGGGLLPHVCCKKIILEDGSDSEKIKVTLSLRIYQQKEAIQNSTWLNSFDVGGQNFLDSMYIQILKFGGYGTNVAKLEPSNAPTTKGGNVFTGKHWFGDAYLPRGKTHDMSEVRWPEWPEKSVFVPNDSDNPSGVLDPIQISNSSLLGKITGTDALPSLETDGKVTTEIMDGKPYYVIPFEHSVEVEKSSNLNLGFAFYAFLDIPGWLSNSEDLYGSFSDNQTLFEQFVVEGPVNAEIVFKNGKLHQIKDRFFIPSGVGNQGEFWEGSVHLHTAENPAPDGYFGDGSAVGDAGDYTGWMQGETHSKTQVQQKLKLVKLQNTKLQDLRGAGVETGVPEDDATEPKSGIDPNDPKYGGAFQEILQTVGGAFQKEKKKDFIRDNDSEFSRLYVSRDVEGNARGMFFFNIEELLKNNSSYFYKIPDIGKDISQIIDRSELLELRLYRDRVKRNNIGSRREVFANDKAYEEPSKLLATISGEYPLATQANEHAVLSEWEVDGAELGALDNKKMRYFVFVDYDVSDQTSGLYQYRLEMKFKDGTWEYLNDLYQRLSEDKRLLEAYYDLATSHYKTESVNESAELAFSETAPIPSRTAFYRPYYDNGAYTPDFAAAAYAEFENLPYYPFQWEEGVGDSINDLVSLYSSEWSHLCPDTEGSYLLCPSIEGSSVLLDPDTGSPAGIDWFIKIVSKGLKRIGTLIGANQSKTGNQYTNELTRKIKNLNNVPNSFTLNASLATTTSPAQYVIMEEHTFGHPRELFSVMSNKNIYIDYFSLGPAPSPQEEYAPIRIFDIENFKNRCHLEAAALSPKAKDFSGFEGFNISAYNNEPGNSYLGTQPGDDRFTTTGYSYLSPSIVNFFAPGNADSSSNFSFSAYSPDAYSYLNSDNPIDTALSPFMRNGISVAKDSLDSFFITLLNYYSRKTDYQETDLVETYFSYQNVDDTNQATSRQLAGREPYKRALENLGITVHDAAKHDLFFKKEAGAVSQDIIESDFTYKLQDFSDNTAFSRELFSKLISDNTKDINLEVNAPSSYEYDENAPNSFKIGHITNNHAQFEDTGEHIQPYLQAAYGTDASVYDSFHYFHLNLTVKIEVFRGIVGNAKDDNAAWTMLTKDILTSADAEDRLLFCRMSYYNEDLTRKITLPILDQYFFICRQISIQSDKLLAALEILAQIAEQKIQQESKFSYLPAALEQQAALLAKQTSPSPSPPRDRRRENPPSPAPRTPEARKSLREKSRPSQRVGGHKKATTGPRDKGRRQNNNGRGNGNGRGNY